MNLLILVRKFQKSDEIMVNNLIRNYIMSNAKEAIIFCIFREITLQLIILLSAIFFIFFGVPLLFCTLTIPAVLLLMLSCVYSSYFGKAIELTNEPYKDCWVAEAYEPYILTSCKLDMDYSRIESNDIEKYPELNKLKKQIIGTMSVKNHHSLHNMGWIYRTAVHQEYNFAKISQLLLSDLIQHCKEKKYYGAETVTIECHEEAREMFLRNGFNMRQIYHKQLIGGIFKIMKSQLGFYFDDQLEQNQCQDFIKIA